MVHARFCLASYARGTDGVHVNAGTQGKIQMYAECLILSMPHCSVCFFTSTTQGVLPACAAVDPNSSHPYRPNIEDEAICPTDMNLIYNEDFRALVNENLAEGAFFTLIAGDAMLRTIFVLTQQMSCKHVAGVLEY